MGLNLKQKQLNSENQLENNKLPFNFESPESDDAYHELKACISHKEDIFHLLIQAVNIEHIGLLWHCLSKCKTSDIENMCRKLSPKEALHLLSFIVEKMKKKNSSWNKLLSWLRF